MPKLCEVLGMKNLVFFSVGKRGDNFLGGPMSM